MKKIYYTLLVLISSSQLFGQCFPDRHNTSWFDGWLSCQTSENPNDTRGPSHWVSYDFGQIYELNELKIWNVNDPDILTNGVQNVIIDYSIDGINWIEYGQEIFPMAAGISTYQGDIITSFNGLNARYLLFTIVDNYGGDCYGFSEIRIAADSIKDENEDVCIIADIQPNPFIDQVSVTLKKKCLGDVYLAIEDATGRTVMSEEIITLFQTKAINTSNLAPGVYFVCLRNGDFKERIKVVKQ